MIRGIHHVSLHCHDLERMIRFYTEGLGFEVVQKFEWADNPKLDQIIDIPDSAAKGAMLRAGTCYLELFQYSAPEPRSQGGISASDKGYTHFCVDTDDIAADMARLKAVGMDFGTRDYVDMGRVRTLYGRDPEGNLIEVQQCFEGSGIELSELSAA